MTQEKTKGILYNVGIAICGLIFVVGIAFIGIVIGEAIGRASVQHENAELVLSYHETIDSKDALIGLLSKTTAETASAVVAAQSQTDSSIDAARTSAQAATSARRSVNEVARLKKQEAAQIDHKLKALH